MINLNFFAKKWKILLKFTICMVLIGSTYAFASDKVNDDFGSKLVIGQEIISSNGIWVCRPVRFDQELQNIVIVNNIKSLEDYICWLKENIKYKRDKNGDVWLTPEEMLKKKSGDCEDFAFFNQAALRVLDYQSKVLALLRPFRSHAICIFKENGYYVIIDNYELKRTQARSMSEFTSYISTAYRTSAIYEVDFETKGRYILSKSLELTSK